MNLDVFSAADQEVSRRLCKRLRMQYIERLYLSAKKKTRNEDITRMSVQEASSQQQSQLS